MHDSVEFHQAATKRDVQAVRAQGDHSEWHWSIGYAASRRRGPPGIRFNCLLRSTSGNPNGGENSLQSGILSLEHKLMIICLASAGLILLGTVCQFVFPKNAVVKLSGQSGVFELQLRGIHS
jgi:hypothetical protein